MINNRIFYIHDSNGITFKSHVFILSIPCHGNRCWTGHKGTINFFLSYSVSFSVLAIWYWSISLLVLEYLFAGTAHEANDVVDGIYYKRMIIAI